MIADEIDDLVKHLLAFGNYDVRENGVWKGIEMFKYL